MSVSGQSIHQHGSNFFKFTIVQYSGSAQNAIATVESTAGRSPASTDTSTGAAGGVRVIHLDGGTAPLITLQAADANFNRRVDADGSGTAGRLMIITHHVGSVAGPKP